MLNYEKNLRKFKNNQDLKWVFTIRIKRKLFYEMARYSLSILLSIFFVIFLIFIGFSEYSQIENYTSVFCYNYEKSEKSLKTLSCNESPRKLEEWKPTATKVLVIAQFRSGKVKINTSIIWIFCWILILTSRKAVRLLVSFLIRIQMHFIYSNHLDFFRVVFNLQKKLFEFQKKNMFLKLWHLKLIIWDFLSITKYMKITKNNLNPGIGLIFSKDTIILAWFTENGPSSRIEDIKNLLLPLYIPCWQLRRFLQFW